MDVAPAIVVFRNIVKNTSRSFVNAEPAGKPVPSGLVELEWGLCIPAAVGKGTVWRGSICEW